MVLMISGSQTLTDETILKKRIDSLPIDLVITGNGKGVDAIVRQYCEENDIPIEIIENDITLPKSQRVYNRLEKMHKILSEYEDAVCLMFWDGISRETKLSMGLGARYKNKVVCFKFNNGLKPEPPIKKIIIEKPLVNTMVYKRG